MNLMNNPKNKIWLLKQIKSFYPNCDLMEYISYTENYFLEVFLERLYNSPYKNIFILKGDFLVSNFLNFRKRNKRSLDFIIDKVFENSQDLEKIINEIIGYDLGNNDVKINLLEINEDISYERFKKFKVFLNFSLENLKKDITLNLSIKQDLFPMNFIDVKYNLLFDQGSINLKSYSNESVIAEKIFHILFNGSENINLYDYYDLWIICEQISKINFKVVSKLLKEIKHKEKIINYQSILCDMENNKASFNYNWNFFKEEMNRLNFSINSWEELFNYVKNIIIKVLK